MLVPLRNRVQHVRLPRQQRLLGEHDVDLVAVAYSLLRLLAVHHQMVRMLQHHLGRHRGELIILEHALRVHHPHPRSSAYARPQRHRLPHDLPIPFPLDPDSSAIHSLPPSTEFYQFFHICQAASEAEEDSDQI
ncbi:hypothetical protein MPTK1_4g21270 [Marchantia polymorpha subsp. ruderalis]|uniref:Uncharacterized protein n=2 Tax=Marchantia polymorpha TaxID=3197 RepID=A0AAF6BC91_MARPO|nr:hypothetical protein MARPO_0090s0094 [Marchantia polymorpha]BBN09625.1 hypothetical protein Mp_4g21270 [Marchantia polymorpha subsp. ruderalis]|eukprot:PTQ33361.1 hypothetical protein MARPO_0090s0094 [Marchantia polymorpha]